MSRAIATRADELLSGTNSNVMGQFYATDDEVPGIVVLGSANSIPNPDFTDVDERGRVRGHKIDAPPAPDSWNVYMRRTTRISSTGAHVVLDNPAPMLRQNESLLRSTVHTYEQDHPLLTDKSLPDLGVDEPTDLAPVLDAPRVEVITSGGGGYPAGSYWFSYCGIIGKNPMGSKRLTTAAPAVQLTGVLQGQSIVFYVPDEIPGSWSGIAFLAGPTASTLRVQKRVAYTGQKVLTQVVDRGPYRRDGMQVSTTTDRTFMGESKEFGPPKVWRAHSPIDLLAQSYELSYKLVTDQGLTASQPIAKEIVANGQNGEALCWVPPKAAVQQPGIKGWIPEFRGKDGKWYTFESAKGGYPLSRAAKLHTCNTDKDHWGGRDNPVKEDRTEKDRSGVQGPKDPMETPIAQGAKQMVPGRYAVRVTTASEKEDMESRPSPRTVVELKDAGFEATGVTSGVTNQSIRVFRPHPQTIRNSRLMEVDPATGETNLHWEKVSNSNVTVTDGDGFIQVASTSTFTGGALTLRRTALEPLDAALMRYYAFRFRMNITSQNATTGGIVRVALRFLDNATPTKNELGIVPLEDFRGVQDVRAYRSAGPVNGTAHVDVPAGTKNVQAIVQLVGATGDTPSVNFTMSNIGMWVGRAAPRKLYDLVLAEDTPGRDAWPVPDEQPDTPSSPTTAQIPHAPGPYCRVITNPNDPAKHRSPGTYVDQKGFEDLSETSGGWLEVETGGATFAAGTAFALRGTGGSLSNVTTTSSSTTWGGYIYKDFSNAGRNTFGAEASFRIKTLPSAGNVTLLGVMQSASTTAYLARLLLTNTGLLQYRWWNGSSEQTAVSTGVTLQPGDDVRLEMSFTGLRQAGGSVSFNVKRNERPSITTITQAGLAWGTLGTTQRVMAGFQNGSATGSMGRLLLDRIRITVAGINETTTSVPGNLVEYWAPEGQPAYNPEHFLTGARWPVKPNQNRVFSGYFRYTGVTTPADGASVWRLVVHDADGNPTQDLGYVTTGLLGRDGWDRYSLAYTTPSDAAYVEITRNEIGDGAWQAMGLQDELGTVPSPFTNTNATSGSFNVILKTTITGGPLDGDTSFTDSFLRMRANTTHAYNVSGTQISTVTLQARGSSVYDPVTKLLVSPSAWVTNIANLSRSHQYAEIQVFITTTDATKSPEVRAVFLDIKRVAPVLCYEDGRDFAGGIIVYQLTPASPIPNIVRKEYADGSVGLENVGRGLPERVKLSLAAMTELGKRQVERNPASSEPYFLLDTKNKRYVLALVPEFAGNQESRPDGVEYFDYSAEGLEADVIESVDLP